MLTYEIISMDHYILYVNELHIIWNHLYYDQVAYTLHPKQLCQNCKCSIPPHFLCIYAAWLLTSRASYLQYKEHGASVTKLLVSLSQSSLCESKDQEQAKKDARFC